MKCLIKQFYFSPSAWVYDSNTSGVSMIGFYNIFKSFSWWKPILGQGMLHAMSTQDPTNEAK
jgi:hypothetical protein